MCLLQPPASATNIPPAMNVMPTASPSPRSEENNGQSTQQPQQQTSGAGTPTNRRQKSWDLLDQTAIAQARQQKQHQVSLNRMCVAKMMLSNSTLFKLKLIGFKVLIAVYRVWSTGLQSYSCYTLIPTFQRNPLPPLSPIGNTHVSCAVPGSLHLHLLFCMWLSSFPETWR